MSCQTIDDAIASLADLEAKIPAEIMAGEAHYHSHSSTRPLVDIIELRLRRIAQACETEKAKITSQKSQVMTADFSARSSFARKTPLYVGSLAPLSLVDCEKYPCEHSARPSQGGKRPKGRPKAREDE